MIMHHCISTLSDSEQVRLIDFYADNLKYHDLPSTSIMHEALKPSQLTSPSVIDAYLNAIYEGNRIVIEKNINLDDHRFIKNGKGEINSNVTFDNDLEVIAACESLSKSQQRKICNFLKDAATNCGLLTSISWDMHSKAYSQTYHPSANNGLYKKALGAFISNAFVDNDIITEIMEHLYSLMYREYKNLIPSILIIESDGNPEQDDYYNSRICSLLSSCISSLCSKLYKDLPHQALGSMKVISQKWHSLYLSCDNKIQAIDSIFQGFNKFEGFIRKHETPVDKYVHSRTELQLSALSFFEEDERVGLVKKYKSGVLPNDDKNIEDLFVVSTQLLIEASRIAASDNDMSYALSNHDDDEYISDEAIEHYNELIPACANTIIDLSTKYRHLSGAIEQAVLLLLEAHESDESLDVNIEDIIDEVSFRNDFYLELLHKKNVPLHLSRIISRSIDSDFSLNVRFINESKAVLSELTNRNGDLIEAANYQNIIEAQKEVLRQIFVKSYYPAFMMGRHVDVNVAAQHLSMAIELDIVDEIDIKAFSLAGLGKIIEVGSLQLKGALENNPTINEKVVGIILNERLATLKSHQSKATNKNHI